MIHTIIQSIPSPEVNSIEIGPFRIYFYALFILTGIIFALLLAGSRLKARGADSGIALDIAIWAIPFGIIGGRIFHVLTHPRDYFYPGADLLDIFKVWEGGLAIFGAIILGTFGAWIGARQSKVKLLSFLDAVAPGVLLAQAIGRLGNYFNSELFGTPTDLPWGLEIPSSNPAFPLGLPEGTLFHPTFLYEMIWSLSGVVLLLVLDRRLKLRWGKMFGAYLIYYSIGRIWTESLRIDPSEVIAGLRINIWSAIFGIIVGALLIFIQSRRHPGIELSVFRAGFVPKSPEKDKVETDQ